MQMAHKTEQQSAAESTTFRVAQCTLHARNHNFESYPSSKVRLRVKENFGMNTLSAIARST
ncbi:hypothetical protein LMG28140_00941 [Paraburkholderia metrosideri]|uniref:Uncharacterized protein n=1 Tax=Paraburkholderia metrosideri TaxID=580937 RepID=A0ABN7HGG0_9BURK|nr:hypothetical protein LMG28140_00941 [Paraburkholderia metrosideri]